MSMIMLWSRTYLPEPDKRKILNLIGSSAQIEYVDCFALQFFVDKGFIVSVSITFYELDIQLLQNQKFSPSFITVGMCELFLTCCDVVK